MLDRNTVSEMLDRLGKAVSSGDLDEVSAFYALPGVFLIGEESIIFERHEDFEKMFAEGRNWYVDQGIAETRAEIVRFDPMTDTIAAIDVRWPGFDANGVELYTETSHYVVQLVDGKPLIRVALSRTT
jgi:hypothetical protein